MKIDLSGGLDAHSLAGLIELLMDPSPARHIRIVLGLYRDRDYAFEHAWAQALRSLPRTMPEVDEWREHLRDTKAHWKGAYLAPSLPHERPVALVQ